MLSQQESINKGLSLPIMEMFFSIQGEGYNTGKQAYFIRLAGCDVGCVWCDVKESWEASDSQVLTIETIVHKVVETGAKNVVITGGEPCLYNLDELTKSLKKEGVSTFLETSGVYEITGEFDWICVSPKKFKTPLESSLLRANELKVIAFNQHDFVWGKDFESKVSNNCELFIQPEWGKEEEILPYVINFVKENSNWRISLQTHKYMRIP